MGILWDALFYPLPSCSSRAKWDRRVRSRPSRASVTVPLVVRLEGTNVEAGRSILHESGLQFHTASSMPEAARLIAHLTAETQREVCA